MTRPRPSGRDRIGVARKAAFVAALVLAPLVAQASSPSDLYFERSVMSAADSRCALFTPEIGAALNAAKAQARGAALRAWALAAFRAAPISGVNRAQRESAALITERSK